MSAPNPIEAPCLIELLTQKLLIEIIKLNIYERVKIALKLTLKVFTTVPNLILIMRCNL